MSRRRLGHDPRGRSCGGLRTKVGSEFTGRAVRLVGKARKGFGLTLALCGGGFGCRRARSGVAGPCPREHEAQPHQGNEHQLGEKESRNHDKTPPASGERGVFYPIFIATELAAGYRYTTLCVGKLSYFATVRIAFFKNSIRVSAARLSAARSTKARPAGDAVVRQRFAFVR